MLVLLSKCIYIILYRDNLFPNARGMACRPQKKSTGQNATTSRTFPAAFPAPGSSKARACRLTPSSKTPGPDARPKKSPAPISPEHPPRHRPARAALRQDHTALERMRFLLDENAPSGLRRILATTCALHPKWAGPATPTGSYSTKPKKPFRSAHQGDRSLPYQQNLTGRNIAVIIFSTNAWPIIRTQPQTVQRAVANVSPGTFTFATFHRPRRSRRPPAPTC